MAKTISRPIRWSPHEIDEIEKALEPHQDFSSFVRDAAIEKAIEENKKKEND